MIWTVGQGLIVNILSSAAKVHLVAMAIGLAERGRCLGGGIGVFVARDGVSQA